MWKTFTLCLFFPALAFCGPEDTIEQLEVGYGNLGMNHSFHQHPVKVIYGQVPASLEGSFARHGCGVLGRSTKPELDFLDRIDHLFDCIEVGQSFSFADGKAFFNSKFYDTNKNDIYRDTYGEDMSKSSVFFSTTYATFNESQVEKHAPDLYNGKKPDGIFHVSWWQVGKDVLAMAEYHEGHQVDPHNVRAIGAGFYNLGGPLVGSFPIDDDADIAYYNDLNPAHQAQVSDDPEAGIISTSAAYAFNKEKSLVMSSRLVYTVKPTPEGNVREIMAEIPFENANLTKCPEDDDGPYPDPEARVRHMHTIAVTEHYVIVPESSYLRDPCTFARDAKAEPGFLRDLTFEPEVNGRFIVVNKNTSEVTLLDADHAFFITHSFGSFEDASNKDVIYMDVIKYDDAKAYIEYPQIKEALYGQTYWKNEITRFELNLQTKKAVAKLLHPQAENTYVEFPNINWAFAGKPYRYGYAVRNVFKLRNAIMKLDFENPSNSKTYELPNGEFGTEPIFVSNGGEAEDDGYIIVNTIDGVAARSNILILNAQNMKPEYKGQAPGLGLFGLHSAYFDYSVGCTKEDCRPPPMESVASNLDTFTLGLLFLALMTLKMK